MGVTRVTAVETAKATALRLLADGIAVSKVAETTGVSRVTLWRWQRNDPHFAAALAAARQGELDEHRYTLEQSVSAAVARLTALLDDPMAPPAVQLRAAEAILDRAGLVAGAQDAPTVATGPLTADDEAAMVESIVADPRLRERVMAAAKAKVAKEN